MVWVTVLTPLPTPSPLQQSSRGEGGFCFPGELAVAKGREISFRKEPSPALAGVRVPGGTNLDRRIARTVGTSLESRPIASRGRPSTSRVPR